MHRQIIQREIQKEKVVEKVCSGKVRVGGSCTVHGSLCMPSPNAQLYTVKGLAHPTSQFEHYVLLYRHSHHNPHRYRHCTT